MPTIEELERQLKKARELGDAMRRSRRAVVDEKILRRKLVKSIRQAKHPGIGIFGRAIKKAGKRALKAGAIGLKAGDLVTQDLIQRLKEKKRKERELQLAMMKRKPAKRKMARKKPTRKRKTTKKKPTKRRRR